MPKAALPRTRRLPAFVPLYLATAGGLAILACALALVARAADDKKPTGAVKPALTVTVANPQPSTLPLVINANGNISAWQEASIGTEANGLRLAEVRVNVGDAVKKGQVLATFVPDTLQADVAQMHASVVEAEATLADAAANAQRARSLQATGALSEATINQYLTAERTAQARLEAQRAAARVHQLKLQQTRVLAPDDGVISARSATVGAVLPAGQELFRMIRQGRLEWRAEVASTDVGAVKPGMKAVVTPAGSGPIKGTVRMVAPTVDPQTRNGLVYVDLPPASSAKAGMFARGAFEVGSTSALTLPQSAVLLRDGFSYVLRVGSDGKIAQTKVATGRRVGDRVEVSGLDPNARVVASGGGFLGDGDVVRVVEAPAAAAPPRGERAAAPKPTRNSLEGSADASIGRGAPGTKPAGTAKPASGKSVSAQASGSQSAASQLAESQAGNALVARSR